MLVGVLKRGIVLTVPPVVVTSDVAGGRLVPADEAAEHVSVVVPARVDAALSTDGVASTKAEAGNPPRVWASPACNAYGTLTRDIRGCSSPPLSVIPNQRACPLENTSAGRPIGVVEPRVTVNFPPAPTRMFCVSIHSAEPPC